MNAARTGVVVQCRGMAIVEFTIVLPLCVMLIMATAEFGRAFLQYNTLNKCVRDGARYVADTALNGSTGIVTIPAPLQTQTKNVVVYGNVLGAGAALLPGLTATNVTVANAGLQNVTVSASYPYAPIFAFVPQFFSGGDISAVYTLQSAVTMRAL